jgi:hypothetical protein
MMKDLFAMLEPDPRWEPELVEKPQTGAIVECFIDGKEYRIERHTHKKDADDNASDEMRAFWKLFIRDANKWRRITLLGPDGKDIPPELLYKAEQVLPWATGAMDRARTTSATLRPPVKDYEEDDDDDGIGPDPF